MSGVYNLKITDAFQMMQREDHEVKIEFQRLHYRQDQVNNWFTRQRGREDIAQLILEQKLG